MFLLEVSIVNAYLCHKECHPEAVNADAKLVLARQLMSHCYSISTPLVRHLGDDEFAHFMAVLAQPPPVVPLNEVNVIRLQVDLGHFPGTDRLGRHSCCLHSTRRPTNTYCRTCGVYLHRNLCFFLFHHCQDLLALIDNHRFQSLRHYIIQNSCN